MDPISITAACVSLTGSIAKTSIAVTTFVRAVRSARSDLDAVSRELASLTTLLELIAEDAKDVKAFPDTLRRHIAGILANCELVLLEIRRLIEKYYKHGITKSSQWALFGGEDVSKLRLSLEAHKSALDIALEMVAMSMTREIKQDTNHLRDETTAIKHDTSEILREIARLRAQLPNDQATAQQAIQASHFTLARYLDDLTSYAETVCWSGEDSDTDDDRNHSTITNPKITRHATSSTQPPSDLVQHEAVTELPHAAASVGIQTITGSDHDFFASYPQSEHHTIYSKPTLAVKKPAAPKSPDTNESIAIQNEYLPLQTTEPATGQLSKINDNIKPAKEDTASSWLGFRFTQRRRSRPTSLGIHGDRPTEASFPAKDKGTTISSGIQRAGSTTPVSPDRSSSRPRRSLTPLFSVEALYNYDSRHADDLSFKKGQIINVTGERDSGWYDGYLIDGECILDGIVRKEYVKKCEQQQLVSPGKQQKEEYDATQIHPQRSRASVTSKARSHENPQSFTPGEKNSAVLNQHGMYYDYSPNTLATDPSEWSLTKLLDINTKRTLTLQTHSRAGTLAVVKMYPRQRQEDEYHNAQILRQVEIIGLLDHPNIVKIYYFTRTLDTWLLYLEHAGSINLAHFITQRGSLSDDGLALRFARQIGAALRYCHLHCVLHNDIRSEKIIVTQHDDIKITGFSSSEFMDERGDECFDTFSYGTIIYHMLWGIAPWPPENNCAWHLDSRTPVTSNLTMHQTPNLSSSSLDFVTKLLDADVRIGSQRRMSLEDALNHPWLTPRSPLDDWTPSTSIPWRQPFQNPRQRVIHKLRLLDFGTPEQMTRDLTRLLFSKIYKEAMKTWEMVDDHGETWAEFLSASPSAPAREEPNQTATTTNFYEIVRSRTIAPLLALYYLAEEKLESEESQHNVLAPSISRTTS